MSIPLSYPGSKCLKEYIKIHLTTCWTDEHYLRVCFVLYCTPKVSIYREMDSLWLHSMTVFRLEETVALRPSIVQYMCWIFWELLVQVTTHSDFYWYPQCTSKHRVFWKMQSQVESSFIMSPVKIWLQPSIQMHSSRRFMLWLPVLNITLFLINHWFLQFGMAGDNALPISCCYVEEPLRS